MTTTTTANVENIEAAVAAPAAEAKPSLAEKTKVAGMDAYASMRAAATSDTAKEMYEYAGKGAFAGFGVGVGLGLAHKLISF